MEQQKPVREKILDLSNKISRTKRGAKDEMKPEYPEYYILDPIVTDDMADVAMCLELRKPQSAAEIAPKCGKSVEETEKLLWDIAMAGVAFVSKMDGVDKYWHEVWVPGHMEMIVNNKENVKKYPQLGKAFSEYGIRKGPVAAGIFPVGTGPMRTIPIERALSGESKVASFEEVSKHLNDAHLFSVSTVPAVPHANHWVKAAVTSRPTCVFSLIMPQNTIFAPPWSRNHPRRSD
jgi:predicted transcriptional regulator